MAGAVVAALAIPLAANAQSGASTGAVGGAIVGGPVGAVVGGVGGAIIGGISDDTDTLDLALAASGCDQARVVHKPRLLSDNGSSYVSAELAQWLDAQAMGHVRGAPYHPQTHGKIERWHQTLKNRILLENYYLPGDRGQHRQVRRSLKGRALGTGQSKAISLMRQMAERPPNGRPPNVAGL